MECGLPSQCTVKSSLLCRFRLTDVILSHVEISSAEYNQLICLVHAVILNHVLHSVENQEIHVVTHTTRKITAKKASF